MNEEQSIIERVNQWIKNSISLKLISVTILVLLLLIPSSMIKSIISEREVLNNSAIHEVSSKWSNQQLIKGPILTIPLVYEYEKEENKRDEIIKYLHILPEELHVSGQVDPEKLKRGMYEIAVYKSNLLIEGNFTFELKIDPRNLKEVKSDQAFLTIGVSDLRGIEDEILFYWSDQNIKAKPGSRISDLISSGITIDLPDLELPSKKAIDFSFNLSLQGSQNLSFTPLGNVTNVELKSSWTSPSFNGNFLPDSREVSAEGFEANWKVLQLNRNFPQSWIGSNQAYQIDQSTFGVDLIFPLDDYQKSMRSAKYAIMTIVLTFLIFFLVEIMNGQKIHPFQYTLVGLSLCLFYILLISITEHSNFNFAYTISTVAVVSMISLYSLSLFKAKKLTAILLATLIGIYSFLFVTLQLADFALLMGSIGLTLIMASTMYFTRNVNWYNLKREATTA